MHIHAYLELLRERERQLADALRALADHYAGEPDVASTAPVLAQWSEEHAQALGELAAQYLPGDDPELAPVVVEPRGGSYGLLLDLHGVWLLAQDAHLRWTVLGQAARALRDPGLESACATMGGQTDRQLAWLQTQLVARAPQALIAAP